MFKYIYIYIYIYVNSPRIMIGVKKCKEKTNRIKNLYGSRFRVQDMHTQIYGTELNFRDKGKRLSNWNKKWVPKQISKLVTLPTKKGDVYQLS